MALKPWDFWADRYDRLWVQKHSLGPTREYVLETLDEAVRRGEVSVCAKLMDLGCGSGQLLREIGDGRPEFMLTGIDFSKRMLELSQARNPGVPHHLMDAMALDELKEQFDVITCTHSLPYYEDAGQVLHLLARRLIPDGRLIIGFASGNSFFDRLILAGVKLTTGKAHYPSDRVFRAMVATDYEVIRMKVIKRAVYMPRIAVYTLTPKSAAKEIRS